MNQTFQAEIDDGLPSEICRKCANALVAFYKFKRSVIDNDQKLRKQLISTNITIKSECDSDNKQEEIGGIGDKHESELKSEDDLIDVKPVKSRKTHQCDVCGQFFCGRSNLSQHMRAHRDDKPYECDSCGKKFRRFEHLKIHKRIHTGIFCSFV